MVSWEFKEMNRNLGNLKAKAANIRDSDLKKLSESICVVIDRAANMSSTNINPWKLLLLDIPQLDTGFANLTTLLAGISGPLIALKKIANEFNVNPEDYVKSRCKGNVAVLKALVIEELENLLKRIETARAMLAARRPVGVR
jgi:hypothetical protein